jgi:phospholipid-binding lipoprotein MlaA
VTSPHVLRHAAQALLLAAIVLVSGCASVPAGGQAPTPTPGDPWEGWNRKVYGFNDKVDEAVLKPVATAYRDVVPELVRTGVTNVLGNIGDVWSAANQLLQGKVQASLDMGMRVLTNTVFGLGGLLDPATPLRLTRAAARTLARPWAPGVWAAGPTSCCRCLGLRRCETLPACW